MPAVDPAWVLALLTSLEPDSPWRETFPATAEAIAAEASQRPIPRQGAERTAALLVAVAWFESTLRPDAEGDCVAAGGLAVPSVSGRCPAGARARSLCLMQVNETNLAGLRATRADLLGDVSRCVSAGAALLRQSYAVCARRPPEERLAWYAGGGPSCPSSSDAVRKSRHRVALAARLSSVRPGERGPTRTPQDTPGPLTPIDPALPGQTQF